MSHKHDNGAGTIFFDKSKMKYVAQLTIGRTENGNCKRKTAFADSYDEAENELNKMKLEYSTKEVIISSKALTLSNWIWQWYNTYKINVLTESVFEKEKSRIRRICNSKLANMQLASIRPINVQSFINELSLSIQPSTIRNIIILLNSCFKQAKAEGYIISNPCESITLPKIIDVKSVALDEEAKKVFIKHASNNPYFEFFIFALTTGMRLSEITGLTRDCIDFDQDIIIVKQQLKMLKGKHVLTRPKTKKSGRHIPMNEYSYAIAKKYIEDSHHVDNFLFYNPKSKKILNSDVLYRNVKEIYKKCYEETNNDVFLDACFHSLRHTFATTFVAKSKDGNYKALSEILGHSSIAFTLAKYVHPSDVDKKNAIKGIDFL